MSEGFKPGVDAARKALGAAIPIVHNVHPGGAKGVRLSLQEVANRIKKGRNDPRVRAWAVRVIKAAGGPQDTRSQAQAILSALKEATVYVQDPVNTEFIQAAHETLCLDDKGLCFRGGDCFPKGTLLLRDDFELVPIENIKAGERIWGFDRWTKVEGVAYKGRLSVDVMCCNNGSMVPLTSNHKVFVARCPKHENLVTPCQCPIATRRFDRVRVRDLAEKDALLTPSELPFGDGDLDPRRALIEGWYLSDGWSEEHRFAISGKDGCPKEAQKHEVKRICDELGIATYWAKKYIRVNDPNWTLRTQQMGEHAPEKHLLSLDLAEAAAAASLRGIMADSGANTNGPGRTFTSTSKRLTIQTRVLHKMFGTSCSIRYIEDHGGLGLNPIWRLGVRARTHKLGNAEKLLRVKEVERAVTTAPCYDIQTEDHYVYLPEHDVTVSNCDDLVVAFGSATLSVGIPTKIIGEAFDFKPVASHVLAAIQDTRTGEWLRVDPSTNKPVGEYVPGTSEEWIDPMAQGVTGVSGDASGDFVGVGNVGATSIENRMKRLYERRPDLKPQGVGTTSTLTGSSSTAWIIGALSLAAVGGLAWLLLQPHGEAFRAYANKNPIITAEQLHLLDRIDAQGSVSVRSGEDTSKFDALFNDGFAYRKIRYGMHTYRLTAAGRTALIDAKNT